MKHVIVLILSFITIIYSAYAYCKETITIAVANNFSQYGTLCADPLGRHFKNSILLAIEDYYKKYPDYKYEIKVDEYDYGRSDLDIISIMNQVYESNAIAVIGFPCSDHAMLAAGIARKNDMVMISPEATTDRLLMHNGYVFRTCFKNSYQSEVLAAFAYRDLKANRIALIVSSDCEYCTDIASHFETQYLDMGGRIVAKYYVLDADMNYDDIVKQVRNISVDALFIPNHELVTSKIVTQLVTGGINVPVISGDAMGNVEGMLFELLKDRHFDFYATAHWFYDKNDVRAVSFRNHFFDKYEIEPNDNSVLAYDGMAYLLEGVRRAKTPTRAELRHALQDIDTFHGIRKMKFDHDSGEVKVSLYLLKSSNDHFNVLKRVDPK